MSVSVWRSRSEGLLGLESLALLATAVPLWTKYSPTWERAYESTKAMRGSFLPDSWHYFLSALLILHGGLHLALCVWTGEYRKGSMWRWWTVVALWSMAFLGQVSGNALPMDRHDAQTVAIEVAVASQVPFAGETAASIMRGSGNLGPETVTLWWYGHLVMGIAILLLGFILVRAVAKDKTKGVWWIAGVALVIVLTAGSLVTPPFGEKATVADFNSFDAKPGWYTWVLHGWLRMFDLAGAAWIGTVILPTLILVWVSLLPWLNRSGSKAVDRGGIAMIVGLGSIGALGFGGSFAPLSGSQDPPKPKADGTVPVVIDPKLAEVGKKLFAEIGCSGCHGIDGKRAEGGPDLTDVHKKHTDPEWYVQFIRKPTSIKPNSVMPAFESLDVKSLRALAEFLRQPR